MAVRWRVSSTAPLCGCTKRPRREKKPAQTPGSGFRRDRARREARRAAEEVGNVADQRKAEGAQALEDGAAPLGSSPRRELEAKRQRQRLVVAVSQPENQPPGVRRVRGQAVEGVLDVRAHEIVVRLQLRQEKRQVLKRSGDGGWGTTVAAWPHGGHLDLTADGAIKWKAHRRTRRWGGSCPELA